MQKPTRSIPTLITLGLLVIACSGCSPKARTAGRLAEANRLYSAGKYDEAEIAYKNALDATPMHPDAIAGLGLIYLDQGRLSAARLYLFKARELRPENMEVRAKLGVFFLTIRRFKEARTEANFVLDHNPQDELAPMVLAESAADEIELEETRQRLKNLPAAAAQGAPVLIALGTIEYKAGHLKEAEAAFKRALTVDGKSSGAYSALGGLYLMQKDLVQADAAYKQASNLAPIRSPKRLQYALFKMQNGDVPAAKLLLEDIAKNAPDALSPMMLLAEMAANAKKFDESEAWLAKVLARESTYQDALLLSTKVDLAKGDNDKAVIDAEKLVAAGGTPPNPLALYQLGVVYGIKGDLAKAADSLVAALAAATPKQSPGDKTPPKEPDYPEATIALAQINIQKGDFTTAIVSLKKLLLTHPERTQAKVMLATAYSSQGNSDEAVTIYRELEQQFPKEPQLFLSHGTVLLKQGKKDEAQKAFEQARALAPENQNVLEQLIELDLAAKDYSSAQKRVEDQIARNPKAASLRMLLARIFTAQGNAASAEEALKKAIELEPDASAAYFLLARIYIESKQNEKALADLNQIAAKNPKDPTPVFLIGVIHETQKDYPAARASYEKVIALNPKVGLALNNLAALYMERFDQLDRALEMAQRAKALLPQDPSVGDTLGWALFKKKQYLPALVILRESAAKLPDEPEVQFHFGMASYMTGDEVAARTALETALKLSQTFNGVEQAKQRMANLMMDGTTVGGAARAGLEKSLTEQPDDPVVPSRLAEVYLQSGDLDNALKYFQQALQRNPKNGRVTFQIAQIYATRKELTKALEFAKTARTLVPADPEIAHTLGRLAFQTADYNWSVSLLQEASQKLPDDAETLFDWAEAAYSIGKVQEAEAAMRHALEVKPAFSRAADARRFLDLVAFSTDPQKLSGNTSPVELALKLDPPPVPALMATALISEQKSDLAGAKQAYEKVLSRYPDFAPAQKRLIILYSANPDDTAKAAPLATKIRQAFSNDPDLGKALGVIAYRQKDFTRAGNLLRESARTRTKDPEVMYYLGMSQYQLKDRTSATSLQSALDLGLKNEVQIAEVRKALASPK